MTTSLPHLRMPRATALLLNLAHAIDHMFLLIFATAVTAIAADFGIARWEDLMPYGVGAFALFGLGSAFWGLAFGLLVLALERRAR